MLNLMTGCSGGGSEETQTDESGATVIKFGIHVANPAEQETVTYNIVEAFNKANDGKYKVEFEAADTETHSKNMKLKAEDGTLPQIFWIEGCNGIQREHNKKLNNGLPILHKVPPKRDYGRYFCILAEKGGTSHGGLTEKLSPFFYAQKQEVNAYGR